MEPPSKRPKVGQAPYDDDDDDDDDGNIDELSMSPTQFAARQDPLYQLDKKRAKAATRLKSAFERIFEKYERDFTGVGDEIDLETGEVIVNNGHLLSLEDEKDRTREGSVLSDEEEGPIKGKDIQPAEDFGHESLPPTNPLTHNPPPGPYTGLNQPPMPGGFNYQLPYPGMQLHPFGTSDPFMFGPPMIGNNSVDPLWQTPELPLPIYQDRFGFMGQPMGYHHQFGYGPSMVPGGYHNGFLGPPFHHQVLKRFPHAKIAGQKPVSRPTPATNDSEEDDILSGNTTQDTTKITKVITTEKGKSPPITSATKKPEQTYRKEMKVDSADVAQQASHVPHKPHRGRPRKVVVSAEQPCSPKRLISPPPLLEKESAILGETTRKLTQIEVLIRAKGPSDVEFYGQMSRTKSRERPATVDSSNSLEDVTSKTSDLSAPAVEESRVHIESEAQQHAEVPQSIIDEELKEVNDKESVRQSDITNPNEERYDDGLSVNHEDINDNENFEAVIADLHSSVDNSGEMDLLFSNDETSMLVTEMPTTSKTPPHSEPTSPGSHWIGVEVLDNQQDSDQTVKLDDREVNLEESAIEDMNYVVEPASYGTMDSAIQDTSKEVQEVDTAQDDSHEITPGPHAPTELEETIAQLPDSVEEVTQPFGSPTMESGSPRDHTMLEPDSMEQVPDQPSSPKEGEVAPSPVQEPETPFLPQPSLPAETSELALRPLPIQSEQSEEISPIDIPSPPKKRPASAKKAPYKLSAPSTPKKRNKTSTAAESTSSIRRTPSSRRKLGLTSLIPDDPTQDDDELSVLSSSVTTSPFLLNMNVTPHNRRHHHQYHSNSSSPRKSGRWRHGSLVGSSTPHHRTGKYAALPLAPATDSRAFRGTKRRFAAGTASSPVAQSSPLARTVVNVDSVGVGAGVLASSPSRRATKRAMSPSSAAKLTMMEERGGGSNSSSSPVRGGAREARRCGEDGFVCERDFCFTCCK
ncbi:hypothetical protein Daesc_009563 [Daldinia eschscholtzii]|uniref:Uncharacterized protein n=1 Tax=Daldinia eschscholtzii TaxID=292717 RepID=A0AAX6MBB1_9PEZI